MVVSFPFGLGGDTVAAFALGAMGRDVTPVTAAARGRLLAVVCNIG